MSWHVSAQTKHALLIGVGDYPVRPAGQRSWADLNSENDLKLVRNMLISQNFNTKNMVELLNERATLSNVLDALDNLLVKVQHGDIIYIHYSGHGQQIADVEASEYPNLKHIYKDEEEDSFDEAFALYNAPIDYFEGYQFNEHLIDDQLDYYISSLEQKLGKDGHVVVVLDACHSGSGTRGSEPTQKRGISTICAPNNYKRSYVADQSKTPLSGEGVKSIFMGCRDNQVNFETNINGKGYGSLTYSLVEAISNLKDKASYKNVFQIVYGKLLLISEGNQNAEKDFDEPNALFFGGKTVPYSDYFEVIDAEIGSKIAVVRAGTVHGISEGDSLGFFYVDPEKPQKMLTKGVVVECKGGTSTLNLMDKLPMLNSNDYAMFKSKRIYEVLEGQQLKLAIEIENTESLKTIRNALKEERNITLVNPKKETPNYYVKENGDHKVRIEIPFSGNAFKEMRFLDMKNQDDVDSLLVYLKLALRVDYFANLELNDKRIDVNIELKKMTDSLALKTYKEGNKNPIPPNLQGYTFSASNNSAEPIYLYVVYLANNKILSIIKKLKKDSKDNFVKLYPNTHMKAESFNPILTTCTSGVDCGVDRIYFFASLEPMDLDAIDKLGASLATRGGSEDPFVQLISEGASGKNQDAESFSGVTLIKYQVTNLPLH
jgi:hypothetical protein